MWKKGLNIQYIVLLSFLLAISSIAQAKIYKWVDENGKTHFSDKPPENSDNTVVLKTNKSLIKKQLSSDNTTAVEEGLIEIRELFIKSEFLTVSAILDNLQKQAVNDLSKENKLLSAYNAFGLNNVSHLAKFKEWIQISPNSYQPYLARAQFYHLLGWKMRGTDWSKNTTASQFNAMNKYFAKAKADLAKVLALNPKSMVPYCLLISMEKAAGDDEKAHDILQKALSYNSSSYIVRKFYMGNLYPRWGGSIEKMREFSRTSQPFVGLNNKLKLLEGYPRLVLGINAYSNDKYALAEKFFNESLTYGDNHEVYFSRGKNYYRMKQYKKALNDFNKAVELDDEDADYYYWRSRTYSKLNKFNGSLFNIERAYKLDPTDSRVKARFKKITSQIKIPGIIKKSKEGNEVALKKVISNLNQSPNNDYLYYKKAKLLIADKKLNVAAIDLKKAIELNPTEFEYYRLLDFVLFKQSKLDEIIIFWNKYIRLMPNDSRAFLERAGTYYHQHNINAALNDAKRSADLGNQEAEEFYQRLLKL